MNEKVYKVQENKPEPIDPFEFTNFDVEFYQKNKITTSILYKVKNSIVLIFVLFFI